MMQKDVKACLEKRQHMHDIPKTSAEVWDSYRETLESRRRSRAREYSHIPFDWHRDQPEQESSATNQASCQQHALQSQQSQQQQGEAGQHKQEETEGGGGGGGRDPARAQQDGVARARRIQQQASMEPHKPPAIPVHKTAQQPATVTGAGEPGHHERQGGVARATAKPKQTASGIKVRREVPTTTKSATAQRLYEASQRQRQPPASVLKASGAARGKRVSGQPTTARSAAKPKVTRPARRNYFGYKPPIHEEQADVQQQQRQQQRQLRRGAKPGKKEQKPVKKKPPFAFYGWNNDQIGAWQNKKTFNVRASKEVDVHALHAALDRGYLHRLPNHAQREWAKPLHTHPFDYEQYQRESGRPVDGDVHEFEAAADDDVYIASSGDGYRPSARMAAGPPPPPQSLRKQREEERGVQWSPPASGGQQHQRAIPKQEGEEEAGEQEPLEQHALTVTFESEPHRDEEVQTDNSCLCCEDEATQTNGAHVMRDRGTSASVAARPSPRRQQQHHARRLQSAEPKESAGTQPTPRRWGVDRPPRRDQLAAAHHQGQEQDLVEAMRKVDMRQPPELESEYRHAYGNWYHQMLLEQQRQQPAFPRPAQPVVLDAHRPQVVQRRVAPRYHFDSREEEDMYRVHYGAKYGGSLYC